MTRSATFWSAAGGSTNRVAERAWALPSRRDIATGADGTIALVNADPGLRVTIRLAAV